jgi:hypothetical protein
MFPKGGLYRSFFHFGIIESSPDEARSRLRERCFDSTDDELLPKRGRARTVWGWSGTDAGAVKQIQIKVEGALKITRNEVAANLEGAFGKEALFEPCGRWPARRNRRLPGRGGESLNARKRPQRKRSEQKKSARRRRAADANNATKLTCFEQAGYLCIDGRSIGRIDPMPDLVAVVKQDQRGDYRHVVLIGQLACIALDRRHGDLACVFKLVKARSAL